MDKSFFSKNRQKIGTHMADNEAMLFFSGESLRKSADEDFPFFTNRNFLYLTGIKQEQSALLLQKRDDLIIECLFVTKPDLEREVWEGRRFTGEEINEISGVEGIEDIDNMNRTINELLSFRNVTTLWLCFDALAPERSFDIEREFAKHIQNRHPHIVIKNSYPLLAKMRKIKAPEEIDAIRKAMQITDAGIRRLMRVAKPGVMEFIGDEHGNPAPRVSDLRLEKAEADEAFRQSVQNLKRIVDSGRVHGDYSTFNILWHNEKAVVIDFPQVLEFKNNRNADAFLERDVHSLCKSFMKQGVKADEAKVLKEARAG